MHTPHLEAQRNAIGHGNALRARNRLPFDGHTDEAVERGLLPASGGAEVR